MATSNVCEDETGIVSTPNDVSTSAGASEDPSTSVAMDMGELRRLQLAHEGMRLLLNSEVKKSEELFRASRYLGVELNAGHSFVALVRAIMTFDDDMMDSAYKQLESTEKFCDPNKGRFFGSSSAQNSFSRHQVLYRKTIIADCLLFEAALVFLKQSLTSYIKGGYLLRKSWKLYEKMYQETESLCTNPSPISLSPKSTEEHVGVSLYDKNPKSNEEAIAEDSEVLLDPEMSFPFSFGDMADQEATRTAENGDDPTGDTTNEVPGSDSSKLELAEVKVENQQSCDQNAQSCDHLTVESHDHRHAQSCDPLVTTDCKGGGERGCNSAPDLLADGSASSSTAAASAAIATSNSLSVVPPLAGDDETDLGGKNRKKSADGYMAMEVENPRFQELESEGARLRGAVYFGYGLLNIIVSLIPPKLMRLANLLGFRGSRRLGLQALECASNSQDVKAPLARIALLWYHTILRPFFSLDGERENAGTDEAERLLSEARQAYPSSPLFLYFRGKICYLRGQLDEALVQYSLASSLAKEQREIEHISLYEKGWIHLLKMEYKESLPCFCRLKNETRWSACYYSYLTAILTGILGDVKQSRELFLQTTKLGKRKNKNLEKFCARRSTMYKKAVTPLMPLEVQLMAIETIYLWRALPFCSKEAREEQVKLLRVPLPPEAEPFHKALRAWLLGVVLNSLERHDEAQKYLMECLEYEADIRSDKHIMSFALYELAQVHITKDEFARARMLFLAAKDGFSGYEFEARLNFKVHSALSTLP